MFGDPLFVVVSLVLFTASLYFARKSDHGRIGRIVYSSLLTVYLFSLIAVAIAYYFTGGGLDESVLYHLEYGLDGAGFSEYWDIISTSVVSIVLVGVLLYWINSRGMGHSGARGKPAGWVAILTIAVALLLNPGVQDARELTKPKKASLNFNSYYQSPAIKNRLPQRHNLVFIYAESLERTYFDQQRFPGLIRGLRELESSSIYFTDIRQVPGTGWTIAGMVASQCGLPLYTPSHGNSMSGMDTFLGSAVCLGDLLNAEGYRLAYYGGASLNFAGKGKFYSTHGFDEIKGRNALLPMLADNNYKSAWGLFDDSLFDFAFDRFSELSSAKRPFGLFLLTLDTHHPDGHPSRSCHQTQYKDGSNPILNAVACSDYLITNFIRRILKSPHADNTLIVLASDHLALRNTAYNELKQGTRRDLFMIIDPNATHSVSIDRPGSMLDIAPTILALMGFETVLGLGRNLLGNEVPLVTGIENFQYHIQTWLPSYARFWDFPKVKNTVELASSFVKLDDRIFPTPILVEFNRNLGTKLRFQFNRSPEHKRLADHVADFPRGTRYLWVDDCLVMKIHGINSVDEGLCYALSRAGNWRVVAAKIDRPVKLTAEELKSVF